MVTKDARFCVACGTALAGTEPSGGTISDASESGFIGRQVAGRYRIQTKLGEGGMGAVYRAEQISLKRTVALKVLKPELSAEPGLVRRFNAEAELAAKLNHPNTVTLYDFGQDVDGSLFIAMEFLEGRSLRELLMKEGPLPPARALTITDQVCASLSDAHGRGIVHRDLKPDNVMLVQIGKRSDVVRVLDFGIAKLRDEQGDITAMPMTRAGDLLGTPQYMAPEQIRGEKVDARTDVYALGAMLYEMVTGRLPFEGPSLMAILSKHLTELPVPPHIRRADLGIPLPLSQTIMDSLQKDPAARPVTMEAFSERLNALGLFAPARDSHAGSRLPSPVPGYPPAFYSSPPPGVPLLRTPLPGSMQPPPPTPPPPGPAPSPYPGAAPGAASPYPSPAPLVAPHGGSPYPSPSPVPVPVPVRPGSGHESHGHPIPRSGSGGRNLVLAIAGLVVIGGAVAIFAATRGGSSGSTGSSGATVPGSAPAGDEDTDPGDGDGDGDTDDEDGPPEPPRPPTDFSITPDRPLYDPGGGPAPAPAPVPPTPGGPLEKDTFDDGIWKGGWWRDGTGGFQLDIPSGFSQTAALGVGSATQFAGSCGHVPCTIVGASFPTPGQTLDADQVLHVMGHLPIGTGANPTNVRKQKLGGRRCVLMEFNNPDSGFTGELAMCPGRGVVPAIAVQTFPQDFAASKSFRSEFFRKRIKF